MVWIHGGAFQSGSAISHPGYFLTERDVIVVAVNYRLNIFGYLKQLLFSMIISLRRIIEPIYIPIDRICHN